VRLAPRRRAGFAFPAAQPGVTCRPMSDPSPTVSGKAWRHLRRVVVFVVGGSVLLVGIAMIVLPGPAVIVIPLGLSILAAEFVWARRVLDAGRRKAAAAASRLGTARGDVARQPRN